MIFIAQCWYYPNKIHLILSEEYFCKVLIYRENDSTTLILFFTWHAEFCLDRSTNVYTDRQEENSEFPVLQGWNLSVLKLAHILNIDI